ncbi:3-phosphoserine/phosphohydroxythreonine transaminase [Alkalicoccus luteus]|uniref:Phosphoserine aminotransferase n=1 Tax=Alkalicoccus luteus TaxID=1237094 RepID=A0A969TVQ3_9BACI|nr:3-phosphoserine/phosphohydroxythreonine transaminase [Alkalicoccus luteus]NJP36594.1 3-phosphoserine/phosphohydroxythreonine transaminase [Alkalicoccus luteus]
MKRAYNFNAGPGPVPEPVLIRARDEMFNFEQSGAAVMELSHRSKLYESIHFQAMEQIRQILDVPDHMEILFLQGGATLQFSMAPRNFLRKGQTGTYVLSGSWSEKAEKEAAYFGDTSILSSSKEANYAHIPDTDYSQAPDNSAYIHLTTNNTIFGTQWQDIPVNTTEIPVFADMSSDILSRRIDWTNVDLAYAGAQKNAGIAGVTIVIISKDLLAKAEDGPPSTSYPVHADKQSLYHTPPTGAIYITKLVTDWILENGGIDGMEQRAKAKSDMLYRLIDNSDGFFRGHADTHSRSSMNVTFRLENERLEKQFLDEAADKGFMGLNGHRSVGGCRASIYNAVPPEHVEALCSFMEDFRSRS